MESLQKFLESVPAVRQEAEHEIDLLRLILQGKAGTMAQRAMLIRVIKQNRAKSKNFPLRLAQKLGDMELVNHHSMRGSYIVPAPRSKILTARAGQSDWRRRVALARTANEDTRVALDIPISNYRRFMRRVNPTIVLTRSQMERMHRDFYAANDREMQTRINHTPQPDGDTSRDRRRIRRQMRRIGAQGGVAISQPAMNPLRFGFAEPLTRRVRVETNRIILHDEMTMDAFATTTGTPGQDGVAGTTQ